MSGNAAQTRQPRGGRPAAEHDVPLPRGRDELARHGDRRRADGHDGGGRGAGAGPEGRSGPRAPPAPPAAGGRRRRWAQGREGRGRHGAEGLAGTPRPQRQDDPLHAARHADGHLPLRLARGAHGRRAGTPEPQRAHRRPRHRARTRPADARARERWPGDATSSRRPRPRALRGRQAHRGDALTERTAVASAAARALDRARRAGGSHVTRPTWSSRQSFDVPWRRNRYTLRGEIGAARIGLCCAPPPAGAPHGCRGGSRKPPAHRERSLPRHAPPAELSLTRCQARRLHDGPFDHMAARRRLVGYPRRSAEAAIT